MWSAHTAAVPFPADTGHLSDAAVRQLDCSPSGWNPFRVSPDLRRDFGNANASRPDAGLAASNQAWEEMVATDYVPQVRSWEPTRTQPLVHNDPPSIEPTHAPNGEDDHDAHTFLCEWTDEHGTCNMDILGDRVWMSHHLSRYHNVVGHERSQRACLWRGCTETMNKGSLARHVVSRHLRAGASCGFCSKVYSRADVARRHAKKCKVAKGALVQPDQTK